jgi:S-adenosylmethionine:tRNA ribosyltransferase-isomerase
MRLADFDYDLPPAAIAQTPIERRDAARLLVDGGPDRAPAHRHVRDLPDLLRPGDLVVVNDTRVIPARLRVHRATGGAAEVLLVEPAAAGTGDTEATWLALVRPSAKLRDGEVLLAADGTPVVEIGPRAGTSRVVRLLVPEAGLERYGEVPLPPYIGAGLDDPERYQTVYARQPGSVAAPTAGLHLTPEVLRRLADRDITVAAIELVVGLDTFKPVTADDPARHEMHSERYRVPAETWDACRRAERVVAVGTTTVRALESAAATGDLSGRTALFIRRPYPWQVVDVLLTNFHLPRTTLLMMIDAFVGPRWRELYATALAAGYRFLSFGDAMLLERAG